jgi:hypothetical protein
MDATSTWFAQAVANNYYSGSVGETDTFGDYYTELEIAKLHRAVDQTLGTTTPEINDDDMMNARLQNWDG